MLNIDIFITQKDQTQMRVALYGNVANNFYQMAKLLRNEMGVDAHLFIANNAYSQHRPESDDPELTNNYPDWIHLGAYQSPIAQYLPMFSPLINDTKDFDYIICSQKGPSLAPYLKPKVIFYVTGGDLTRMPFYGRSFRFYSNLPARLLAVVRAYWQRKGILAIDETWAQPFSPNISAMKKLGLKSYNRQKYFPVVLDPPVNTPTPELDEMISGLRKDWDFIVFQPARMVIDETPDLVAMGEWKNNLALLYGFADFVKKTKNKRVLLAVVNKASRKRERNGHKRYLEEAKRLGIQDQVIALQPPVGKKAFTRAQMFRFYELCDVVGGDFGVGWFGSVVIEGLAMAKPVISYVDDSVMTELYGEHPLINVREPDDISSELIRLYQDGDYRRKIGKTSQKWYEEHHSPEGAKRRYIKNMEFLTSDKKG